jgi:hypothetical protein
MVTTPARVYGGAQYMDVKSCLVVYAEGMTAAEQKDKQKRDQADRFHGGSDLPPRTLLKYSLTPTLAVIGVTTGRIGGRWKVALILEERWKVVLIVGGRWKVALILCYDASLVSI